MTGVRLAATAARVAMAGIMLAACAAPRAPGPIGTADMAGAACPALDHAVEVTDRFMSTFNERDMAAHEATYHFPHVRIASGRVLVLERPGTERDTFERLTATGWHHSAWADRRIIQCAPEKVHMLTTFVRYRADGSELSRFNSLYIIEHKAGRWGVTGRSSFAP